MFAARISILIGVFFAVAISPKLQSTGQSAKEMRWVTVSDLNGPINKSKENLSPEPLIATDTLRLGDTVIAGAKANGRLRFFNETTIMIRSNSQLTLEGLEFDPFDREKYHYDVALSYGEIACGFPPMNHQSISRIRTPAGTINVDTAARFRVVYRGSNQDGGFDLELSVLNGRVVYEGQIDGVKKTLSVTPDTRLIVSGKLDSSRDGAHFTKEPAKQPLPLEVLKLLEEINP